VAGGVDAKLVRRHPHVFDGLEVAGADEVVRNWDSLKRAEKPDRTRPLDGVPPGLPALQLAAKALRRAGALAEGPNATEHQAGDELLEVVTRLAAGGVDVEAALRRAVRRRFA